MTPTPIEAAHGRKLIAVVVPKEAKDFSILPSHRGIRYRLCKEYHGHPEGEVEVKYVELTIDTEAAILGTLHHDGDKWVSSFDVEPFVDEGPLTELWANYNGDEYSKVPPGFQFETAIESFISLLNSYGFGYLNNPLGEEPDWSRLFDDEEEEREFDKAWDNWARAEEGVLQPNQQLVFIEQLNH